MNFAGNNPAAHISTLPIRSDLVIRGQRRDCREIVKFAMKGLAQPAPVVECDIIAGWP
jgi:hypothetical protein